MRAGAGRASILPRGPVELSGWLRLRRQAAGVHDPIWARTLVMESSAGNRVVLVSLDLLGTPVAFARKLRWAVGKVACTDPQAVLIACTHTHSAPAVLHLRGCGTPSAAYLDLVEHAVTEATAHALHQLRPASLIWGKGMAFLSVNRREVGVVDFGEHTLGDEAFVAGTVDPEVDVLLVRDAAARPIAVVFAYAAHPVTLRRDNLLISADFPGVACETVEARLGSGAVALFLNGACGDVNPRTFGTSDRTQAVGWALARTVTETLNELSKIPDGGQGTDGELSWAEDTVDLPLAVSLSLESIRAEQRAWRHVLADPAATEDACHHARVMLEWSEEYLAHRRDVEAAPFLRVDLQAVRLAGRVLLAIPGEAFCEIGLAIKALAPGVAVPVGYANGNVGYFPSQSSFRKGGYEVEFAYRYYDLVPFAESIGETLLSSSEHLLDRVLA